MTFDREPQSCHCCEARTITGDSNADFLSPNKTARCLNTCYARCIDLDACDFAILHDIDAMPARSSCVTPDHCIVANGTATALQQSAVNWKAQIVELKIRSESADLFAIEKLRIDAMQTHRIAATGKDVALNIRMVEVQHSALADHDVVVESPLEPPQKLQRPFVERHFSGKEVVGGDDRRVAAGMAGTDPASFQNRHIGDAVHLG